MTTFLRADPPTGGDAERFAADLQAGRLTAEELLSWYCTYHYARTGSYEATARQLQIDRRTVKAKVDPTLLARLAQRPAPPQPAPPQPTPPNPRPTPTRSPQ